VQVDAPQVRDIKAFVPAKDLGFSIQFYSDLGFKTNWSSKDAAEMEIGSFRFLLQRFYVKEHATNFMMSLNVEDADEWWKYIEAIRLTEKYPNIMARPPAMQPWGIRVLYLSDPTGVLWHIAEIKNETRERTNPTP
jgi:uncharacterized glyoxalase superfamily protein PhnB